MGFMSVCDTICRMRTHRKLCPEGLSRPFHGVHPRQRAACTRIAHPFFTHQGVQRMHCLHGHATLAAPYKPSQLCAKICCSGAFPGGACVMRASARTRAAAPSSRSTAPPPCSAGQPGFWSLAAPSGPAGSHRTAWSDWSSPGQAACSVGSKRDAD